MKLTRLFPIMILVVAIIGFSSCEKQDMAPAEVQIENDLKKAGKALPPGEFSIAEEAIDRGFDSLVAALSYVDNELGAGLVDLFSNGTDQYTVFAPTNQAFIDLVGEEGAISDLPAALVLDVLLYHVTEGRRAANSVVPKKMPRKIETLLGESFYVNSDLSITAIGNNANIIAANVSASNGIIHVIDAVILPIE